MHNSFLVFPNYKFPFKFPKTTFLHFCDIIKKGGYFDNIFPSVALPNGFLRHWRTRQAA